MKKLSMVLAIIFCLTMLLPFSAFAADYPFTSISLLDGTELTDIEVTPGGFSVNGTTCNLYTVTVPAETAKVAVSMDEDVFWDNEVSNITYYKSGDPNSWLDGAIANYPTMQVYIDKNNDGVSDVVTFNDDAFVICFAVGFVFASSGQPSAGELNDKVVVSADPAAPTASTASQTVTVTVDFTETIDVNAISADNVCVPDGWSVTVQGLGYAGESGTDGTVGVGYDSSLKKIAGGWSSDEDYRHIHGLRLTYTAPANAQGSFTLGCEELVVGNTAGISVINGVNATKSVTIAAPTPAEGYTVTVADATEGTAEVEIGDSVTMNVTVTGAAFNGLQGTVTYDKSLFELKSVSGSATEDDKAETDPIELYTLQVADYADGATVATLTFEAKAAGTGNFTVAATVGDYVDFRAGDAIQATTVSDSVKVKAAKYTVTTTNDTNATVSSNMAEAEAGETVTITVTPSSGYQVDSVNVIAETAGVTVEVTKVDDTTYTFTMPASNVSVTATVSEMVLPYTVEVSEYITGINLVLVTGDAAGYTYDGQAMYKDAKYGDNVFAYLDETEGLTKEAAAAKVAVAASTAADHQIAASDDVRYDVNGTGKVDFNDAGAAFGCYNKVYARNAENMAMYLRADVDGNRTVTNKDVSVIMDNYTKH